MKKVVPLEGFGGGGTPLNFKIVAYATEEEMLAAQPKENTIGVITNTTITNWAFSVTEPTEPEAGMVWISVGDYSSVEFNALKNSTLQVYPMFVKQYEGDKFVDVTAMTYQGGEWHSWRFYLYKAGDQCNDITGGWTAKDGAGGTTTFTATHINCVTDGSDERYGTPYTVKKVDVTKYSKLVAEVNDKRDAPGGLQMLLASSITGYKTFTSVASVSASSLGHQTIELDISTITGEYQVMFYQWKSNYTVNNVWLE